MRKIKFRLLLTVMIFFISEYAFSNKKDPGRKIARDSVQLFFQFGKSDLNKSYRSNEEQMQRLDSLILRNNMNLDSITIGSFTSIDGDEQYNKRLSLARSSSVKKLLETNYSNIAHKIPVHVYAGGEDWEGLLNQAYERKWIPDRTKLIAILEDSLLSQSEKKKRIYTLRNGEVFDYLNEYVFWRSRNTSSIILWYKYPLVRISPQIAEMVPVRQENHFVSDRITDLPFGKMKVKSPLFALKSNLLFDAATIVNLELEFPVRRHFSIAGEWTFPFWKAPKSELTLNLLYGKLDCKYWLGDRLSKPVMIGWFCDVYGGYGKYDFQPFSEKGVQGTFFNVGMGAGYAHTIHKNLRLEYAIGLGYIRTAYNKYDWVNDTTYGDIKVVRYPWKRFHYNWIGPTKLAVSLVWMINREKFK